MLTSQSRLYVFALSFSVLMSFWCAYSENIINPDGICYLLSAQSFSDTKLQDIMHLCPQASWPFYSYLIYLTSKLSALPYYVSAYFLDGVFTLFSVIAFISMVKEIGGAGRVLWFAALCLLLLHDFNGLRQSIIRDHGYWAAYLWSIWVLLKFNQKPRLSLAIAWSVLSCISVLFRREGIVLLIFAPFCCGFMKELNLQQRIKAFIQLNLLSIMILMTALVYIVAHPELIKILQQKVVEQINTTSNLYIDHYTKLQEVFKTQAFNFATYTDIRIIIVLSLFIWYLLVVTNSFTWIFAALSVYGLSLKKPNRVIITYLILNTAITLIFLLENQFLSKRYVMALELTLLLYAPFALEALWQRCTNKRGYIIFISTLVAISCFAMGGIVSFGPSKAYMQEAGNWAANNIPDDAKVYSNNFQMMYYSKHFGRDIFKKILDYHRPEYYLNHWQEFDYLLLKLDKNERYIKMLVDKLNMTPIQRFQNKRGDLIAVYKIKGEQ